MTEKIVEMLDQLGEYNAQATLLEIDKRKLLDQVKIPEEVRELSERNAERKAQIDAEYCATNDALRIESNKALSAIVVPEEVRKILDEIDAKRKIALDTIWLKEEAAYRENMARKAAIDAEFMAQVQGVYQAIETRKLEIAAEFGEKAGAVEANIAKLTAKIKSAVAEAGVSVKGRYYHAVYVKGRVTWNTDMLDGLIIQLPALEKARKTGEPSVTLRKV
jgi:hypothetical protein